MNWTAREITVFALLLVFGALLSIIDHHLDLHTMLVESVHALVVTGFFIVFIVYQRRYPEVRQFGWNKIILGIALLMIGSWIDLLDDPPAISLLQVGGVPFGRSWQQAFLKKIVGYTGGVGLIAYGFFQWIPWMIETRTKLARLNGRLSQVNMNMNRLMMSLDDRVESERLNISRELHDDVAQQLTFLKLQIQLCQREIEKSPAMAQARIAELGGQVGEILKTVRHIARDLRPEPLFALGLVPALEQFLEKTRQQAPEVALSLECLFLPENDGHVRLETRYNDRELLHLFRVLQEGVRNALKHSGAGTIELGIREYADRFEFTIRDDGKGLPWSVMPPEETLVQQGHLGLAGLRERVEELSGTFRLSNRTKKGVKMEITLKK